MWIIIYFHIANNGVMAFFMIDKYTGILIFIIFNSAHVEVYSFAFFDIMEHNLEKM